MTINDIIFKKGIRVECPLFGYGTIVENREVQKEYYKNILVKFDNIQAIQEYTPEGAIFSYALPTLKVVEDPFEGLPEWVSYIATDIDGNMFAYENEPIKDERGYWRCNRGEVENIKWNKNWKSSLIKRHK